jgi:hypothetical protein
VALGNKFKGLLWLVNRFNRLVVLLWRPHLQQCAWVQKTKCPNHVGRLRTMECHPVSSVSRRVDQCWRSDGRSSGAAPGRSIVGCFNNSAASSAESARFRARLFGNAKSNGLQSAKTLLRRHAVVDESARTSLRGARRLCAGRVRPSRARGACAFPWPAQPSPPLRRPRPGRQSDRARQGRRPGPDSECGALSVSRRLGQCWLAAPLRHAGFSATRRHATQARYLTSRFRGRVTRVRAPHIASVKA